MKLKSDAIEMLCAAAGIIVIVPFVILTHKLFCWMVDEPFGMGNAVLGTIIICAITDVIFWMAMSNVIKIMCKVEDES